MALCPLCALAHEDLSGWEYRWGDPSTGRLDAAATAGGEWRRAHAPLNPPGRGSHTVLWLRVLLPHAAVRQPSVYLDCVYYDFEAYYRGEPVSASMPAPQEQPGRFRGRPWRIITLPDGSGGDYLYLRVRSLRPEIGIPGSARFGSYEDHIADILRGDLVRATVAFMLALSGVLALLVLAWRRDDRSILWGGCALVLLGIWNISNTRIKLLYLNDPILWLYAEHGALYFAPVAIGLFLERIFGRGPGSAVRRGWQFLLAYAIVSMAASLYDPYWLRAYTLRPFQVLLALYLIAVCAFITREALRGDIDARIAASGLAAAILSGLYDIAVSFLGLSFIMPKFSYLGLLAFITSLGIVLDRRLRVVPAKLMTFTARHDAPDAAPPAGVTVKKKTGPASLTPDIRLKLDRTIAYIQEHYAENISREGLAALVDMNYDYLGKMFILYTGKKVSVYINELRVLKAAGLLSSTDQNIVNIALSAGYENLSTFYRVFQGVTGLSPLAYRERFGNK